MAFVRTAKRVIKGCLVDIHLHKKGTGIMTPKLSQEELSSLFLEISLLLHAGVMAGDALSLLAEEAESDEQALLKQMAEAVDGGASLSAAMRESGSFPGYAYGLTAVGERSGRTEEALSALSRYYEQRVRMERQIRSALLYPAMLFVLMMVVIGVLLVKVLPIFDDVYASLGGQLSGVAGGLLVLGRWIDKIMPFLWVIFALAILAFVAFAAFPDFRQKVLSQWYKNRGEKGLSKKMAAARMSQALAMGMRSGMLLEEALELAGELVKEEAPAAARRCKDCLKLLEQGERPGAAMRQSELLPPTCCRLLETAQRGGSGDMAMERIAQQLSEESDAALEGRINKIEPALVLVCSVLVGMILLSVMLPMMHIMSAIG